MDKTTPLPGGVEPGFASRTRATRACYQRTIHFLSRDDHPFSPAVAAVFDRYKKNTSHGDLVGVLPEITRPDHCVWMIEDRANSVWLYNGEDRTPSLLYRVTLSYDNDPYMHQAMRPLPKGRPLESLIDAEGLGSDYWARLPNDLYNLAIAKHFVTVEVVEGSQARAELRLKGLRLTLELFPDNYHAELALLGEAVRNKLNAEGVTDDQTQSQCPQPGPADSTDQCGDRAQ